MPRVHFALTAVSAFAALAVAALVTPAQARAQDDYAGSWNAGPTRVSVQVESWGADCPPRPQSTTIPGGGTVRVTEDGDHLTFHGRRTQRSDRCWSENSAVRVVTTSHQPGQWRVICRSPPDDSRRETGTYTLSAQGDDRLVLRDVSQYDWQLNESRCRATITSSQTFTRVSGGATPAAPDRPDDTPDERPGCTPGAPETLRLRPAEAQIEPGGEQRFRARVVDAAGCTVRSARIRWELRRPASRTAELSGGVFRAAETAAEAEGEFVVVASSGDLTAEATVVVRTMDLSDLIARRTSSGVVESAGEDSEVVVSGETAGVTARSSDAEEGSGSLPLILAGVAGVGLLLLLLLVVALRRGKKSAAPAPTADGDAPAPEAGAHPAGAGTGSAAAPGAPAPGAPEASAPRPPPADAPVAATAAPAKQPPAVCPVCHQEFDDPRLAFCPNDGAELVQGAATPEPGQPAICPTCRRGYAAGTKTCPTDGDDLVPYALFVARRKAEEATEGGRICPVCGERYGRNMTFCGKDGAELVTVN